MIRPRLRDKAFTAGARAFVSKADASRKLVSTIREATLRRWLIQAAIGGSDKVFFRDSTFVKYSQRQLRIRVV
jgi:hypothetical protein